MSRVYKDKIDWHYINLRHRTDRLAHIQNELIKAGLTAERYEAKRLCDYVGPRQRIQTMMRTPHTVGNFLSHLGVWGLTPQGPDHVIGVLEDDALLCSDMQVRLQYIEDHFDRDWDILYLGATYHVNPPVWHKDDIGRDFELTGTKHIHRVYGAFCNQGYLINPVSVPRLTQMMLDNMHNALGHDHCTIQLQPHWQCFSFTPGCVFQIDNYSDIGQAQTVFSNFYKLGQHVFVDKLEDFDYDNYNWAEGQI